MGCFSTRSMKKNTNHKSQDITINANTFLKAGQGSIQDNYTITKTLGSGAFADVKLCIHKPTHQKRAVKFIHKAGLHKQQMDPKLFLQQVKVLKQLDHPNILRCFQIFEDRKNFYVSTEFCEGGQLFDKIIELKHLTESQAAQIMFQLLSAVAYCHDHMVIHRDLKPENILLEEAGNSLSIKVADFGSSCFIDTGKRLSGCFGSAYYVAPEVLQGEYNEKCDIWSIGVIMFILLTGRPPYPGSDQNHILKLVKTNPLQVQPQKFPQLSEDAILLLQSLLQVNVKRRISAREALLHPWILNYRNNKAMPNISDALANLKGFNSTCKLKDAVHIYIATQIMSRTDLKQLKESFQTIDSNGDGRLSMEELLEAYSKSMGVEEAKMEVERIMQQVDDDRSGDIDYSEFLRACMDYAKYMSQQNLETAFRIFDTDGSGDITLDELKKALAGEEGLYQEEAWQKIIKEVDENGDGVIDLKEFKNLMTALNKQ